MMKGKDSNKKPTRPSKEDGGFDPESDKETKEILRNALASFLKEKMDDRDVSRKNIEALIGVVEEFLNSFIILGYTFEGTPVQYICAHNQQQADSLATLVNKFFQHVIARDNPNND